MLGDLVEVLGLDEVGDAVINNVGNGDTLWWCHGGMMWDEAWELWSGTFLGLSVTAGGQ